MCFGGGHGLGAEWKRERRAVVPGLPLVHVIGTEKISAFSGYRIQRRLIQVCHIRGESLGRAVKRRYCLHVYPLPDCSCIPGPDQCEMIGIFPSMGCWISSALNAPQRHDARSFDACGSLTAASTAAVKSSS